MPTFAGASECKNYIPWSKRPTKAKKVGANGKENAKKPANAAKQSKAPKKTRVKEMSAAAVEELKAMITSQVEKIKLTDLVVKFHTTHSDIPKKLIKSKIREVALYKNGTWSCGTDAKPDSKGEAETKASTTNEKPSTKPSVLDLLAAAPPAKAKPKSAKVVSAKVPPCSIQISSQF